MTIMDQAVLNRIRATTVIRDAREAMKRAQLRCIPFDQLLERIYQLVSDADAYDVVYAILEHDLNKEQHHALAKALSCLLPKIDRTRGIDRGRLDRQVGRLLPILPTELSHPIAIECISHVRKSRRTAGLKCLNIDTMDEHTFRYFIDCFDKTRDDRILKALLKHPIRLECINPTRLLKTFNGDDYWQARVIEATLRADFSVGLSLAETHPFAFVWAAGRLGNTELLPTISHCLDAVEDKLPIIGIVTWAYGKLGAVTELIALHPILEELEQQYDLTSGDHA